MTYVLTTIILLEILLKKRDMNKCDPFIPSKLNVNKSFAQKVRRRKCDPLGPVDSPNLHHYY